MARKYRFDVEEYSITVTRGEYSIAEFYPDIGEAEEEEGLPEFNSGTLEYPIIITRKFIEEHFNEGDGLDKLETVLEDYLAIVRAWKGFLKQHPDVKVECDGFAQFAAKVFIRFEKKLKLDESCLKAVEEKLTPVLESLDAVHTGD